MVDEEADDIDNFVIEGERTAYLTRLEFFSVLTLSLHLVDAGYVVVCCSRCKLLLLGFIRVDVFALSELHLEERTHFAFCASKKKERRASS